MTSQNIRIRYVSLIAAAVFMTSGVAMAQQAGQPATAATQIAPLSDKEATQFVAANKKVTEVANKMSAQLQGAKTEEDVASLQTKAEKEIVTAIQKEGLTPTRYQEIIVLAENDEATLAKLRAEFGG
ncbi:DUF4168 domain-containing protein [Hyphomonas sp. WL0036]|uniref:DUF4168 domain-containing protein n=1 Tax=Hyphomonas sediminis TaxID=2866160 RepID=UPI001C7E3D33|nr:DUF4168 domain-containing protein [Hyphomonas sediminis]MBY9066142.1 DUF4168 domain-containing protein [Hyphomonas sediminis]